MQRSKDNRKLFFKKTEKNQQKLKKFVKKILFLVRYFRYLSTKELKTFTKASRGLNVTKPLCCNKLERFPTAKQYHSSVIYFGPSLHPTQSGALSNAPSVINRYIKNLRIFVCLSLARFSSLEQSILRKFVKYGRKKFCDIGSRLAKFFARVER
jgi:hypothetical protein